MSREVQVGTGGVCVLEPTGSLSQEPGGTQASFSREDFLLGWSLAASVAQWSIAWLPHTWGAVAVVTCWVVVTCWMVVMRWMVVAWCMVVMWSQGAPPLGTS